MAGGPVMGPSRQEPEAVMSDNKTRVLLTLPGDVLEHARVFVGKAMATLKLTVSLQMVLRALIEEGLRRHDNQPLLANVESQAHAVRRIRRMARRGGGAVGARRSSRSGTRGG